MNGYQGNPCLKTGGWVHLPEQGEYIYGDIYGNGTDSIWVRMLNRIEGNIQPTLPQGEVTWAVIYRLDLTFCDERVSTYVGLGRLFFYYDRNAKSFRPLTQLAPQLP